MRWGDDEKGRWQYGQPVTLIDDSTIQECINTEGSHTCTTAMEEKVGGKTPQLVI